eukprot:scaffold8620_cov62-Phaeocystis_antarctica.AAC.17
MCRSRRAPCAVPLREEAHAASDAGSAPATRAAAARSARVCGGRTAAGPKRRAHGSPSTRDVPEAARYEAFVLSAATSHRASARWRARDGATENPPARSFA